MKVRSLVLVLPLLVIWLAGFLSPALASPARIKDLVEVDGVRGNDLLGYGLVVGLNNTGDTLRNSPFTEDAIMNLLERLGVNVSGEQIRARNVAAVLVTATLPPFARAGGQIDVTVSAIGDAKSLLGGTLVMTPLNAADGQNLRCSPRVGHRRWCRRRGRCRNRHPGCSDSRPDPGRRPGRARGGVRFRPGPRHAAGSAQPRLYHRRADRGGDQPRSRPPGRPHAQLGTVQLDLAGFGIDEPARLMAQIENIEVQTSTKARVVVDQRSGTIILGADVRISRVAVTQGNLTLRVEETPLVVQPNPFADGQTVVIPRTDASIQEDPGKGLAMVEDSVSLPEVVSGLNALGVSAHDMIDILKSIKAAGALHAEFIVQ